jgi:uncharacterized membrane protein YkvA (DUF1232 family)
MAFLASLKQKAHYLKMQTLTLYFASRDPRTPWYAKVLAGLVVAYAFSPIDLIPDFIPVLGLLDDLILLPAGITLAIRLIPKDAFEDAKRKSVEQTSKPVTRWFVVVIVGIWLGIAVLISILIWNATR